MFCRHLLGVRKQINTEGVLQELGMTPIAPCTWKATVKNWERIQGKRANQLLIASNMNAMKNHLPWTTNIQRIFTTNGLLNDFLRKANETEEVRYKSAAETLSKRLIDQFHQTSFGIINTSSKMKVLNLVKKEKGRESYLEEVTNSRHRSAMTKLRLSGHRLEIEIGRYQKDPELKPEERICKYCKVQGNEEMEDEAHFLVRCPMYNELREKLLPPLILQNDVTNDTEKFTQIMTEGEPRATAKFVYESFDERDLTLDVLGTLNDLVSSTETLLKKTKNPDSRETLPKIGRKKGVKTAPLKTGSFSVKNISGTKLILSYDKNLKDGNKHPKNDLSCRKNSKKRYRISALSQEGLKMTLTKF